MSRPVRNRPSTWNAWLQTVHATWRAATDAWEADREAVALGYSTEMAEYAADHPAPRFADYLKGCAS